jgi:uncharacterized protein (TIGR02099 family)
LNLPAILAIARQGSILARWFAWFLILLAACFSLLLLSLRYWLLPDIERYRENIASAISHASGQYVTIGEISADWDGFRPYMMLGMIRVHDKEGNTTLLLHRLSGTLSWLSILHGNFQFREIKIDRPDLVVRRDTRGVLHVAGFALNAELADDENGFSDWLLRQRRVIINNASIVWQDDQRAAPELELLINLRLENRGSHHRFGIRAVPPSSLATQMDMRGDFIGPSLSVPEQWRGQLFIQIDRADIATWYAWLPVPQQIKLDRATGALRLWAGIDGADIRKLTADMRLQNVKTRLAEDLPELELTQLLGRIGWQKINDDGREGAEWFAHRLRLGMPGKRQLQPVDFLLQLVPAHAEKNGSGKLSVDRLNLKTLGDLVEYLPVSATVREQINAVSPRGEIHSSRVHWDGEWSAPLHFNARGKFTNLGMRKSPHLPAFSGITGNMNITEKGGTMNLNSERIKLDFPDAFHEPLLLDFLTGQASWSVSGGDSVAFKFSNISFSNNGISGLAYGTYDLKRDGVGTIDLTGHLAHADARYLANHLPPGLAGSAKDWLEKSVVEGKFADISLHFKGNPAELPFSQRGGAILRAQAKASEITLDNLPGWPKIENISGNFHLHGNSIEFDAAKAHTFGTELSKVKLVIADMSAPEPVLQGELEADGPTRQFLKVAAKYSGNSYGSYGANADNFKITGNGRLLLKLDIPLPYSGTARVAGNYEFIDNQLDPGSRMPGMSNINGKLIFNDSRIRIENLTGQLLGGPIVINAADTPEGGLLLSAHGKVNLDNLDEAQQSKLADFAFPWKRHLRGGTAWQASVRMRDKLASVSIDSTLQGIVSSFPEPFSKSAADIVPLHFERKAGDPDKDELVLSYGGRVAARLKRARTAEGNYRVERGAVSFGATPTPLPGEPGITAHGGLPALDLDQWLGFLKQFNSEPESSASMRGIDVQIGVLDFLGRRFNDVALSANKEDGAWYSSVIAEEINGNIIWDPSGNGRVVARLNRLVVPATSPKASAATQNRPRERDFPALDVTADNFVVDEKKLGRLELIASPYARNWRIEKLHISNRDSSIDVKGVWQNRATPPRVQATLTLESNDLGRFLTRLGHPDRVKRGSGTLEGSLSWYGSPQSIDYPTLSGNFKIDAGRGQFPKFEPGIGRLFGIFDLRTLPRRITLDFHDVFSEGFGFNDISGNIKIARGIAVTDDLRIEGPAAKVIMKGEINLETETQNLEMIVTPSLGIATPVVGVASMIASKTLQNPTTSKEYNITGTLSDPVVVKISGDAQQPEEAEN